MTTRETVIQLVQRVFSDAGRNCYTRELESCIDSFMRLPALQLAEFAEHRNDEAEFNNAPRDYKVAVIHDGPKPDFQGNSGMETMWDAHCRRVVRGIE